MTMASRKSRCAGQEARLVVLLLFFAAPLHAQTEEQLRSYFEGKSVLVRIEMPGTDEGVDVYPGYAQPIDFPRHAQRLKRFGTAIRRGEEVLVTKIKVKKDLIEFQLAGGGYGTFGDDDSPDVSWAHAAKSKREKNLERDVQTEKNADRLREMREELDDLRLARERNDALNRTRAEQAKQLKEANIRQRRIEGGSRFNIRYKPALPSEALTPEGVMRALADYVDFAVTRAAPVVVQQEPSRELRRGLTVEEMDKLFGAPETVVRRLEGMLSVTTSTYRDRGRVINAEFVEGVLIRYSVR